MSTMRYYNQRARSLIIAALNGTGTWAVLPRWLREHSRLAYIIQANLSLVPWADQDKIRALREEARARTAATGERHVVDHIIPLAHPRVCGLTVHENLRVVHWLVNARKGNHWNPDQLELDL